MAERLTAVLASHNRREKTLSCLASLAAQAGLDVDVDVVLLDDASTDGTPGAVAVGFPQVRVLTGDGQRFWNGGMRLAMDAAVQTHPDLLLWLNDDVVLDRHALATLLAARAALARRGFGNAIVGGAVRDPLGGGLTYGGVQRRSRLRRLRFDLVPMAPEPVQVETMHGNCVLLPRGVVERVGNLDPAYRHALGDFDYGLRARAAGCSVWMAPGTVGTCPQGAARNNGGFCNPDGNFLLEGRCNNGSCDRCTGNNGVCAVGSSCCSGNCEQGFCGLCKGGALPCQFGSECCSGVCNGVVCIG